MAANLQHLPTPPQHTLEEYFDFNETADARYEYWDGEFMCMSGGSPEHATICTNLAIAIGGRLRGGRCRAFTGEMAIKTPALPPFRYPDLSVVCGEPIYEKVERYPTLVNPILLIEVLSRGTIHRDQREKRSAYQAIVSVREYVLVSQDEPLITRDQKQGEGWIRYDYEDLRATLELVSVECRIPLSEVYEHIAFA